MIKWNVCDRQRNNETNSVRTNAHLMLWLALTYRFPTKRTCVRDHVTISGYAVIRFLEIISDQSFLWKLIKKFLAFKEPKGSLLWSQKPAVGSCLQYVQSSSQIHVIFLLSASIIMLLSMLGCPVFVPLLQVLRWKWCMEFSYHYACYMSHTPHSPLSSS